MKHFVLDLVLLLIQHAIDVLYHRKCWATHVTNVLRRDKVIEDGDEIDNSFAYNASKVDFIGSLSEALEKGKVFDMGTLDENLGLYVLPMVSMKRK